MQTETVEIEIFYETFEVPRDWLLKNIEQPTIEQFLVEYTWGESEWLYGKYLRDKEQGEKGDKSNE